jgi:hypothetical protein
VLTTRRLEPVVLAIGVLGLLVFGYLSFGFHGSLPQVDPSQGSKGVTRAGTGIDGQWVVWLIVSALTTVAAAGLPVADARASRGSVRGAVVQGIGGLVVGGWTVVAAQLTFYFSGPGDGCTYSSCWPLHEQAAAFVVPGVVTGLVMIAMALLVNRLPWSIRVLVPVVVWVAAVVAQYAIWTSYLLPIFEGPPR